MTDKYFLADDWYQDTSWSLSDGGPNDTTKPTASDHVFMSTGAECSIDGGAGIVCAGLDVTQAAFFDLEDVATISLDASGIFLLSDGGGSYIVGQNVTITPVAVSRPVTNAYGFPNLTINASNAAHGITLPSGVIVTTALTLTKGTLTCDAGQDVSAGNLSSSNSNIRTLDLTGATAHVGNSGGVGPASPWDLTTATNLTFAAPTTLYFGTGYSANFKGGAQGYNNLVIGSTAGVGTVTYTFTGLNTFANFTVSSSGHPTGLIFTNSQQANQFSLTDVTSLTGNLVQMSGTVIAPAGCTITSSTASGGATFDARLATNGGGNIGWEFMRSLTSVTDGDWDDPDTWHDAYTITGINQGTKTITIAGNHVAEFMEGDSIVVAGSTGNDGTYVVVTSAFTTTTQIIVTTSLPSAVADGTVQDQELPDVGDTVTVDDIVLLDEDIDLVSLTITGTLEVDNNHYLIVPSIDVTGGTLKGDASNKVKIKGELTVDGGFLGQAGDSFYLGLSTFIDATIAAVLYLNKDASFDLDTLGNSDIVINIMSPNVVADLDGQLVSYAGPSGCVYTMGLGL